MLLLFTSQNRTVSIGFTNPMVDDLFPSATQWIAGEHPWPSWVTKWNWSPFYGKWTIDSKSTNVLPFRFHYIPHPTYIIFSSCITFQSLRKLSFSIAVSHIWSLPVLFQLRIIFVIFLRFCTTIIWSALNFKHWYPESFISSPFLHDGTQHIAFRRMFTPPTSCIWGTIRECRSH